VAFRAIIDFRVREKAKRANASISAEYCRGMTGGAFVISFTSTVFAVRMTDLTCISSSAIKVRRQA
jgi:hypothetical protein